MKTKIIFLFILSLFVFIGCSSNGTKGGGTETGDPGAIDTDLGGLIGGKAILDKQGNISLQNVVIWTDENYDKRIRTDNLGEYLVSELSPGEHIVYAKWKVNGLLLMGKSDVIEIGSPKSNQKPFIYLGQSILMSEPAQIKGMIINYVQNTGSEGLQVRLRKTIFKTTVQMNGVFELSNVPEGTYTIEIFRGLNTILVKEIELKSGETLDLGLLSVP